MAEQGANTDTHAGRGAAPTASVSRKRVWALRLVSAVVLPLLLLVSIECVLRLTGVGHETGFFLRRGSDGKEVLAENDRYSRPFFPTGLERRPWPFRAPASKLEGTCRVFILGGSAAMGDPDPSYGLARQLSQMLAHRYPGISFDVINAAMPAINSYVVRDIAADCARQEPDLFVVYLGNNEVVGPFGPGTVFRRFSPRLGMVRASIYLRRTRLGQWLRQIADHFVLAGTRKTWGGLSMFVEHQVRASDPRLQTVYASFKRNLEDIVQIGRHAGASVVLCSVPTDLRSTPPFASLHAAGLRGKELDTWKTLYERALEAHGAAEWKHARERYEQALRISPDHAESHYRLGRCLEALGDLTLARESYVRARDEDALRFRADSTINQLIRGVAENAHDRSVIFADTTAALRTTTESRIIDDSIFLDHVHLTFFGTYVVGRLIQEQVDAEIRSRFPRRSGVAGGGPLDLETCATSCAYTSWDIFRLMRIMYARFQQAPFTLQMNHAVRIGALLDRMNSLHRYAEPEAVREAKQIYEAAIATRPQDWVLHRNYGSLLGETGEHAQALRHLAVAYQQMPSFTCARSYGEALANEGRLPAALELVRGLPSRTAVEKALLLNTWGSSFMASGRFDDARVLYEEALRMAPLASIQSNLGLLLFRMDDLEAASQQMDEALRRAPDNADVQYNAALILAQREDWAGARKAYLRTLELQPDNLNAHYNLARVDVRLGDLIAAESTLLELVRLRPRLIDTYFLLGDIYRQLGRPDKAEEEYGQAVILAPDHPDARRKLADLYEATGRPGEAVPHLEVLAAGLADQGLFEEAARVAHRALALLKEPGQEERMALLKEQLSRYEEQASVDRPETGP